MKNNILNYFTVSNLVDTNESVEKINPVNNENKNIDSSTENEWNVDQIDIYTDGSCINNGKKNAYSSWAYHIYKNDTLIFEKAGILPEKYGTHTNQKAELCAILFALNYLLENNNTLIKHNSDSIIRLYSDSEYSIKCLNEWSLNWTQNDWKIKKNSDLIKEILSILPYLNIYVAFKHVYAHQPTDSDTLSLSKSIQNKKTNTNNFKEQLNKHSVRNNLADQSAKNVLSLKRN